jgi:hypothetical protein
VNNMKRKKLALLVLGCVFLCLVILREIGLVDVNLYKSMLSTSQSSNMTQVNRGQEEHFRYHLTIKHNSETLHNHTHSYDNLPRIDIEVVLEEPSYSGNWVLPLVKTFKMTYQCEFTTKDTQNVHAVNGNIEGEVTAKIHGLCSRRKAKDLAFEEAKKQIASYFQKQFNP